MRFQMSSNVEKLLTEAVITLEEARAELASVLGKRPDKATLCRWIHRGCYGTKLEAIRLGRQLLTSREALTRFISARTVANSSR
jgi:hypothetical protein